MPRVSYTHLRHKMGEWTIALGVHQHFCPSPALTILSLAASKQIQGAEVVVADVDVSHSFWILGLHTPSTKKPPNCYLPHEQDIRELSHPSMTAK